MVSDKFLPHKFTVFFFYLNIIIQFLQNESQKSIKIYFDFIHLTLQF